MEKQKLKAAQDENVEKIFSKAFVNYTQTY
jgi:hypothetical protein